MRSKLLRVFSEPAIGGAPHAFLGQKALVVHGDDFGMSDSVNQATIRALEGRALSSASVMVPCPKFHDAAAYVARHPQHDIGIHLTLTSEWQDYRWGPVAPRDSVRSLLDPDGYFWCDAKMVVKNAQLDEIEVELNCQIQRALSAGIRPTHLDTHMFTLLMSRGLYAVYAKVARHFRLPFLALGPMFRNEALINCTFVADDKVPAGEWTSAYVRTVQELQDNVSQVLVHVGLDNHELRAITGCNRRFGSEWRQRDFDVITSKEFRMAVADSGAILVGWEDLLKSTMPPEPVQD